MTGGAAARHERATSGTQAHPSAEGAPPVDATPAGWRSSPWTLLAVLTAVNAVNWADRQVVPILFPGIRDSLGLSDTQLGVIGGVAFSFIYAISSFAFGRAADRGIRRNIVVFGLVIWSIATAAGGLATGFWSLFAARFLTGIGEASLYPAAMSLLAERFPVRLRGRAMGIFGAASALGGAIGFGVGGALAETYGWRNVFVVFGLSGIVLAPLVMVLRERPRTPKVGADHDVRRVLGRLIRDVRLLSIWLAGTLMMASGIGYSAWVPSLFVRERGLDVAAAGYLFGLSMLVGGITGSVLGGFMAERGRRRRLAGELDVSATAALLGTPLALAAIVSDWPAVYLTAGLLAPLAIFAFFPCLQTVIVEIVPPHQHGLAYAINILFLGGMGTAMGPFIVGAVSDATGDLKAAMLVPVAGMFAAGVLIALAGRVVRARTPVHEH